MTKKLLKERFRLEFRRIYAAKGSPQLYGTEQPIIDSVKFCAKKNPATYKISLEHKIN